MSRALLALNAGSSSLKFALYDADGVVLRLRGHVTGLDQPQPEFVTEDAKGGTLASERWSGADAESSVERLVTWIEEHLGRDTLVAAGHRIVHGGADFSEPVRLDAETIRKLKALTPLAPLHQPASLLPVRQLAAFRPDILQIACFDTAFHHGMIPPASRYALPRALEHEGVRRYGFHGLSYESIAAALRSDIDGAADERIIVAHLGSGASLCAMRELRSVDTTMGFSALDGIVMGTRSGALDPGILIYLQRELGYDVDRLEHLLYHECGLLGISGISSDVQRLLASTEPFAREALDQFAFAAAGHIAMLGTTLGGIDRLVFTGGIGEHAWQVRAMIADRLRWLGIVVDETANQTNSRDIESTLSTAAISVIATDEEGTIARHVASFMG